MFRNIATATAVIAAATVGYAGDKPLVMTRYTVKDVNENKNQPLMHILIPKDWKAESQVKWTLASIMAPHSFWARFTAPDNSAAMEILPVYMGKCSVIPGGAPQGHPGPKDAIEGLTWVAKQVRPNAKVIASNSTKMTTNTNNGTTISEQTATITVAYTLNNKEVEEEFAASLYIQQTDMSGFVSRDWFVHDIRAIRANKGNLAEMRAVGEAMRRTAKPTAEFLMAIEVAKQCVRNIWQHNIQMTRIDQQLWQETNRQINDTWRKTTEERWASQQKRYEQMNDLLGGVNRFTSHTGHEVLLPQTHKYAWEGPNDTYIITNDPSYRPDVDFTGTWRDLKPKY